MDIDEQEVIEFDDQMDNAAMFAGGISVDSRELTTPWRALSLFCLGSYPKWNECSNFWFCTFRISG